MQTFLDRLRRVLPWVFGFFTLFFLFLLVMDLWLGAAGVRAYKRTAQKYAPSPPSQSPGGIQVDFAALQEINPDICGWLDFPPLSISYPVLQGEDNEKYLTHMFDGSSNPNGSLFLDAAHSPRLENALTLLYGHNMNNGAMLGGLAEYLDPEFYDPGNFFYYYLPGEEEPRVFQILTFAQVPPDAAFFFEPYTLDSPAYREMLAWAEEQALYPTGLSPDPARPTLALVTCTRDGKERLAAFCQETSP